MVVLDGPWSLEVTQKLFHQDAGAKASSTESARGARRACHNLFLENQGSTPVPFQKKRNRTVIQHQQLINISLHLKELENGTSSAKDRAKIKRLVQHKTKTAQLK
jgi:hypothetical protein